MSDVKTLQSDGIPLNIKDQTARNIIAIPYDPANGTYEAGDVCINGNQGYKALVDISTPEVFDPTKWEPTTLGELYTELKSNLTDLIKTLNLGSITTNANGMYIVNDLMFDNAIVLASKGTYGDGFFTEQRPSVSGNVVLKCMDDNNTILKSKTITNVVLYYIEK